MNYFEELLESYDKLKKRKLIIRVDERGEFQELEKQNPDKAKQIDLKLQQEFQGYQGGFVKAGEQLSIGNIPAVEIPEGQNAANMQLPADNQAYAINIQPKEVGGEIGVSVYFRAPGQSTNTMIMSAAGKINPRTFAQYKNALANSEEGLPMLDGDVDTSIMNAGNLLGTENNPSIKKSFQNLVGLVRAAAAQPDASDESWSRTEGVGVQGPASYITGNRPQSLERKLSKLQFVKINPASERLETVDIPPAVKSNMIESALQSMENLYTFGSNFSTKSSKDKACELLSNSIRTDVGGKLVALTSEDSSEGVRFTPSPADKWFMQRAEKICDTPITAAPRGKVDQHSINDYVGKTSEAAGVSLVALDVMNRLGGADDELFGFLADYVKDAVVKDVEMFMASFGRWGSDLNTASTDEEGNAIAYVVEKLKGFLGDNSQQLMSFFKRLGRLQAPLTQAMDPDIVVNVGKEKGQGIKADNAYIYIADKNGMSAEERAKEKATKFGLKWDPNESKKPLRDILGDARSKKLWMRIHNLTDADLDREVYHIGNGLKTKAVPYKESTLGETDRLDSLVAGTATTEVQKGYDETVRKRLGISQSEVEGLREYNRTFEAMKADIDTIFPQGGLDVFDPEKGNIKASDGKAQINVIQDILEKSSTFADLEQGPVLRLFRDKKGKDLDLSDPVNMAKVNEGLKRYITSLRMTQDSNDRKGGKLTDKAITARRLLMYQSSFIGGVEVPEISTVQDIPTMQTMTGSHMATLNDATKGVLSGEWDVEMPSPKGVHGHPGSTIKMVNRADPADNLPLRQTRTWGAGGKANTRWSLVQPRHSFEKRAKINDVVELSDASEDVLYQYMNNQNKLLEQLVGLIRTT